MTRYRNPYRHTRTTPIDIIFKVVCLCIILMVLVWFAYIAIVTGIDIIDYEFHQSDVSPNLLIIISVILFWIICIMIYVGLFITRKSVLRFAVNFTRKALWLVFTVSGTILTWTGLLCLSIADLLGIPIPWINRFIK